MTMFKVLCFIGFVLLSSSCARQHEAGHGSFHHNRGFHKYKHILKRRLSADQIFRQGPGSRRPERFEESSRVRLQQGSQSQIPTSRRVHKGTNSALPNYKVRPNKTLPVGFDGELVPTKVVFPTGLEYGGWKLGQGDGEEPQGYWQGQGGGQELGQVRAEGDSSIPFLSSFQEFLSGKVSDGTSFKITDNCRVTASKTGTLYQLGSNPPDCVNLAILLERVLPNDKAKFESNAFLTLEDIIIRSISLDTSTEGVEIAAAYTGTATLIEDILTIANIRVQLSFVSTRSDKFNFDISGTFSIGVEPVDVKLIRNEEGYYFSADATGDISATTISTMFKQENSFLPSTGLQSQLKKANFDKFVVIKPRLRATFANGYGFLFAGSVRILDWDPFDINVLINKPNDLPTTVTIALYTDSFSISKMLKDLLEIDISAVPVLGTAEVRNLAFSLSTGDVETPLTVLDISSEDVFELPYSKGLKVSFEILIAKIYVPTSIFISPTLITFTTSQEGELNLGHVIQQFLPDNDLTETTDGVTKLKNWPPFIPDPLSIAVVEFHLEASKPTGSSWALTKMKMKVKMTDEISLFGDKIRISNLELDLNYEKEENPSTFGVVVGRVALGSASDSSPMVDANIPFPFSNQEISFTFTDFNVKNVVEALAGPGIFPTDFPELFENIQLDKIAIAFGDAGSLSTISVDASIPGLWQIFGDFSIGNVKIHFEYGKEDTSSSSEGDGSGDGSGDGDGSDSSNTHLLDAAQSTTKSTWRLVVEGQIVIASCTITIEADLGTDLVSVSAEGARCSVSVGDILEKINLNAKMLPSIISGFTIFNPKLRVLWQRTGDNAGSKSIAFAATTSLFYQSEVELALIRNGAKVGVVAGFAVQADAISEISFLSSLGLTDVAVVYVSEKIPISPYEFINPSFKRYISSSDDPDTPEFQGVTIYARFVPGPDNMLGHILREGVKKDDQLKPAGGSEPQITVKISFPALIFELEVNLGSEGLQIGSISGWRFTKMKLIISKRLIGLSLECKINLDSTKPASTFTGEVSLTFAGTVTISLFWEGEWNNPFGLSERLTIRRLGLALGINIVTLLPSFGITGAISVDVPSTGDQPAIDVELTLCIDTASPDKTVFELHFTRLLLEDLINLFAGKVVKLPEKLAKVGFPDEVQIYFSPAGNPSCFGKSYDPGVEIHGTLQIPFLSIRARIDLSIVFTPFQLDANLVLDPIIYLGGLLKVVDADTDSKGARLKMYITENLSDLMIDGSCRIEIFGAMISVKLQINKDKFFFDGRLNLWNLFQVYILVDISITTTSPSVHVIGEMQNDLFAKLKQKAAQAIQSGARAINEKIGGAIQKVSNAQNEVNKLQGYIDYHERKIGQAIRECNNAAWYEFYICIGTGAKLAYHGAAVGGLWTAKQAAIGVLEAAKYILKGVQAVIKVGADVVQTLVNAALSIIDIQYVKFEVHMNGVTRVFDFNARIVILGWTFTPNFRIDFSSSQSANQGISSAGQAISDKTMDKVKA